MSAMKSANGGTRHARKNGGIDVFGVYLFGCVEINM